MTYALRLFADGTSEIEDNLRNFQHVNINENISWVGEQIFTNFS